jgi:hypothetical protein
MPITKIMTSFRTLLAIMHKIEVDLQDLFVKSPTMSTFTTMEATMPDNIPNSTYRIQNRLQENMTLPFDFEHVRHQGTIALNYL